MDKKYDQLNIHQKLELLISDMVDKEVRFRDALKEFQKIYIETSGRKYKGNKTKMAEALGVHRNTLHNKAKSLKIKRFSSS
jgi:DNA-binding NtrC family response regulator